MINNPVLKFNTVNKINLSYLFGWLTVVFSIFIIESVFVISPVHISALFVVFFLIFKFFYKQQIIIKDIFISVLLAIFYFAITQILFIKIELKFLQYLNYLFKLFYFIITVVALSDFDKKTIIKITEHLIGFSIILFTAEVIIRLILASTTQIIDFSNPLFFYALKAPSIMYQNTCMLGFQIVVMFFLTFYLNTLEKKPYYTICQILLFIFCLLTFSRASISTVVIFWIIFKYYNFLLKSKSFIFFVFILMILIISKDLYIDFLFAGTSLDTKIAVIPAIINYLHISSLNEILIGNGFFNVVSTLGETGDTFISRFFIGSGLIGTLVLLSLYLHFLVKTRLKAGYLLLPVMFHGLFLFSDSTVFYCSLAIIYLLEKKS